MIYTIAKLPQLPILRLLNLHFSTHLGSRLDRFSRKKKICWFSKQTGLKLAVQMKREKANFSVFKL
jgi:hypothetical protein